MISLKKASLEEIRENQEEILDYIEEEFEKINQKLDLVLEILENKFQIKISDKGDKIS